MQNKQAGYINPAMKLTQQHLPFLLIMSLSVFVLAACGPVKSGKPASDEIAPAILPENFVLPSRVAVLPFKNRTGDPDAATHVRRIFYNFFSSLNYRDSELYIVDKVLRNQNWWNTVISDDDLPWEKICRKLNIDGFVTGTVHEYGKIYAFLYSQTTVTLAVEFRSCHNGSYIWQDKQEEAERDGEIPFSATGLAAALVTSFLKHEDTTALGVAAELSMHLTSKMPNPPSLLAIPPTISLFLHNGGGRLLLPGQLLRVVMSGDPGLNAQWQIPGVSGRLPMVEKDPGIYIGQYKIRRKDRIVNTQLTGFLEADDKTETQWVDILEPVTIGSPMILPRIISQNLVLTPKNSPYLLSDISLIKEKATLQIQPGTAIWAAEKAGLLVNGKLTAIGEPNKKIKFRGLSDSPWKGITLNNTGSVSELSYVEIRNADIALNTLQASVNATGLLLENNHWGIVAQDSQIDIKNSVIRNSEKVGLSCRQTETRLIATYITGNKTGGGQFEKSSVVALKNAFFNNGLWDVKNLDSETFLQLGNNWWGTTDDAKVKTLGKVYFKPLLQNSPEPFINYY